MLNTIAKDKLKFAVLTGDKATGIPILDYWAWGRWPHYLSHLMSKYNVPHSFCVTLLFLWDATMGTANSPEGEIALSQIPARTREVRKYIAALCIAGIFKQEKTKPGGQIASTYSYVESTSPQTWEKFFIAIATIVALGGLHDEFPPEKFGKLVAGSLAMPIPTTTMELSGDQTIEPDEETKRMVQEMESQLKALSVRPKPKGGRGVRGARTGGA